MYASICDAKKHRDGVLVLLGMVLLGGGCGTSPHGGPAALYALSGPVNSLAPKPRPIIDGTDGTSPATAFRFRKVPERGVEIEEGYWLYHHCSVTQIVPSGYTEAQFIEEIQRSTNVVAGRTYDVLTVPVRLGIGFRSYYFDVTQVATR
jgi:hypothetical protein